MVTDSIPYEHLCLLTSNMVEVNSISSDLSIIGCRDHGMVVYAEAPTSIHLLHVLVPPDGWLQESIVSLMARIREMTKGAGKQLRGRIVKSIYSDGLIRACESTGVTAVLRHDMEIKEPLLTAWCKRRSVSFRTVAPLDQEAFAEVFSSAYTPDHPDRLFAPEAQGIDYWRGEVADWLADENSYPFTWLAEEDGCIIAGCRGEVWKGQGVVMEVGVLPGLGGYGIGKQITALCANSLLAHGINRVYLTVSDGNLVARHTYRHIGFEDCAAFYYLCLA